MEQGYCGGEESELYTSQIIDLKYDGLCENHCYNCDEDYVITKGEDSSRKGLFTTKRIEE